MCLLCVVFMCMLSVVHAYADCGYLCVCCLWSMYCCLGTCAYDVNCSCTIVYAAWESMYALPVVYVYAVCGSCICCLGSCTSVWCLATYAYAVCGPCECFMSWYVCICCLWLCVCCLGFYAYAVCGSGVWYLGVFVHTVRDSCVHCLGTYEYAVRGSCVSVWVPMGMLSVVCVYAFWVSLCMLSVVHVYAVCCDCEYAVCWDFAQYILSAASVSLLSVSMLSVVHVYAVCVSVSMLSVETVYTYSICYMLRLYACCLWVCCLLRLCTAYAICCVCMPVVCGVCVCDVRDWLRRCSGSFSLRKVMRTCIEGTLNSGGGEKFYSSNNRGWGGGAPALPAPGYFLWEIIVYHTRYFGSEFSDFLSSEFV